MNSKKDVSPKKRSGLWWKIPSGVFLLMFMGLAVLILNIDSIAHSQINKALKRYLSEGGALDAIDIGLKKSIIELKGLIINTPKGFGKDPFLALNAFEMDVDPMSLLGDEIVVKQLAFKELSLTVVRNKEGQLSPLKLLLPKKPVPEPQADNGDGEPKPLSFPAVRIDSVRFENFSFRLIDQITGENWSASLRINLSVDGLLLKDLLKQDIQVDKVLLALSGIKVDQPAGYSETPLAVIDKVELASGGIDLAKKRLHIRKVLLDQLKVSVERNKKGVINIQQLIDAWVPIDSKAKERTERQVLQASAKDSPKAAFELPTMVFEDIQLKSIAMQLLDHAERDPWRAGFENLDIRFAGLSVGDLSKKLLSLDSFALDLKGIVLDQPPGFDSAKLASLERFEVTTGKLDLASPEMIVKQISIQGPNANVMVNKDGLSNVKRLNQMLFGSDNKKDKNKKDPVAKSVKPAPDNKLPVIRFEKVQMERGSFKYRDDALIEETLVFPLDKIRLVLTQLSLFDENKKAAPASVSFSFEMEQPGELPSAYFGSLAAIGPVGKGLPPVNSQIRLTGFKLDTLRSLVPPATHTTLGGDGFDAGLVLALNNDRLNMFASILSDRNIHYDAIHAKGPLDALKVELGAVLAGVINRVSGALVNVGKKGFGAGFKIAEGGVNVTKELGSGTLKVGKNLGKSIFEIGSGIVTLDRKNLKEGLTHMTRDTVGLTVESARGAGTAAGGGLQNSFSNLKGNGTLQAWDNGIPERHQAAMNQAKEALAEMPYPPVTD